MIKRALIKLGVSHKIFTDVGIIFFANLSNNGVYFLINIAIAKWFSYEHYGQFSVATNIAITLQTIAECGINLTMIRLYKQYSNDYNKQISVVLWSSSFKILEMLIIFIGAIIVSNSLSSILLPNTHNPKLVFLALITGGLLLLWEYFKALFQSRNNFGLIAGYTFWYSLFRAIAIGLFFIYGLSDINQFFLGVYAIPIIPLLAGGFHYLTRNFKPNKNARKMLGEIELEFINYSKWMAVSGLAYMLMQSSLIFMASYFLDLKSVSLINTGLVFTAVFGLFNTSATQVLLPKVAAFDINNIRIYKKKLLKVLPVLLAAGAAIILAFSAIMLFFLGENYRESLPIFWISGFGDIIITWLGFYSLVLHSIKRPDITAIICLTNLFLFIIGGYFILNNTQHKLIFFVSYYVLLNISGELIKRLAIKKLLNH